MLSTARLLGQATGAAGVAILFQSYQLRGPEVALYIAAGVAIAAAAVSLSRFTSGDGHSDPSRGGLG
jgi:DHA2 family multidrug resistance protein-like MFS transporter